MIKTQNERAERHRGSEPNVIEGINVKASVYSAAIRDGPNQTKPSGETGGNLGNTHTVILVSATLTERGEHTHTGTDSLSSAFKQTHTVLCLVLQLVW